MSMIKTVIVDDESMARMALERLCDKFGDIEIVAQLEDGLRALEFLKDNVAIDLVFLDIDMPEVSGIELIESLSSKPEIIITTSTKEHAFEAFEHSALDYLIKPIAFPRFNQALEKFRTFRATHEDTRTESEHLFVKSHGRLVRLAYTEILFIESMRDYVIFKTPEKRYIVHSTLKNVESKLKGNMDFCKVHRSYIVNLTHVVDIEDTNLVIADRMIPISRSNRASLLERLNTM